MTTVVCVLKTGGIYDSGHVARLAHQVRRHSPRGTSFVCLTDDHHALNMDVSRRLEPAWPSWWSKVAAWALPGPALLLDLDLSILGDLSPLLDVAARHDLVACRNFWAGDPHKINSSVLAWRADAPKRLHEMFAVDPERWMAEYGDPAVPFAWGDQAFLSDHADVEIKHWQTLLPGAVLSFKRDLLLGADARNCRMCVSHGLPRPWDSDGADGWLRDRKIGLPHF